MRLVLQPIKLDDRFFPDISFMLPALPEVFRFDDNFAINKPISKLPLQLFDCSREQYLSDSILSWLDQSLVLVLPENTKLLAVGGFDAYFGKYNFCFGQAIIGGRVAAIYLERLLPNISRDDHKFQALFAERIIKEAIHELSHTFGLRHCSIDSCIMFKSKTISDTDRKSREFCRRCLNPLSSSFLPSLKRS
jgi:archaemetzincin